LQEELKQVMEKTGSFNKEDFNVSSSSTKDSIWRLYTYNILRMNKLFTIGDRYNKNEQLLKHKQRKIRQMSARIKQYRRNV